MNAAVTPNNSHSDLLFVHDVVTKTKWLIDGGAVLSILPPTAADRVKGPTDVQLQAANGTKIPCYGTKDTVITLADRKISFPVTVAEVKQPILGADFLAHSYLAPNHRDGTLVDLKDHSVLRVNFENEAEPIRVMHVSHTTDPFYQLLDSYPNLSNPSFRVKDVDHGVFHFIPTEGPPVQSRARKLSPEKLAVAKAELDKLVELGVCERGKSDWSSPLLVTTKPCSSPCTCAQQSPCGGWRVCGDYRRLNNMTTDDRYPVRNLQDFNNDLRGKKFFSKVDLLKGYHQIPVNPADVKKTAVITPFGLYLFPRCPFGLKNAGQDFQRLMDRILGDIPHTFVYLDDILIASSTKEEHLEDLKRVFDILEANGLVVNRKKCILGQPSVEFLGHLVDAKGILPLPEKVETILQTKPPTSIKELRRYLGMINYYRRFVKAAAHHLYFLFDALKANPKRLNWSDDMQTSFEAIKHALANSTMLHHPDPSLPLAVTSDASDVAIGAVIEQRGPQGWEPLAFFSKKLSPTQQDWPPYDRELHAAHKAIRHFRHMVEGRKFTLYTDHQSLVPSLSKKTDAQTARQNNQLSEIAEYTTDIRYLEGKSNVVADALSRPNGDVSFRAAQKAAASACHICHISHPPAEHPFRTAIMCILRKQNPPKQLPKQFVNKATPSISSISTSDPAKAEEQTDIFDEMEERYNRLLSAASSSSSTTTPSTTASAAQQQHPRQKKVHFAAPPVSDKPCSHPESKSAKEMDSTSITWKKNATSTDDIVLSTGLPIQPGQKVHAVLTQVPAHDANVLEAIPDLHHLPNSNSKPRQENSSKDSLDEPLQPHLSSDDLQNRHVFTSQVPRQHSESRFSKFQQGTVLSCVKRNDTKIPDDKGRFGQNSTKNQKELNKNSQNDHVDSFSPAESIGTIPEPPSSTVSEINEVKTQNEDKKLPQSKLEDLQLVVNAIDHYQIDMEELARQQTLDPDFRRMIRDARTGLSFRKVAIGDTYIMVDVSNGPARPFVPLAFRRQIFDTIHGLGHPGIARTRQSIAAKFVWPNMAQDVSRWARECLACQRAKVHKHTVPPIQDFAVPAKRFAHIHADLVSMPPSNGYDHLLTIVDRFSRWPVAIPIPNIHAETIVDAFAHNWIANYGVPEVLTTDRGSQFTSAIWTQLLKTWGVKHITTTAYHPESNGMVERLHRRLKESIIALGNGDRHGWFWKLPMTMLAIRTTIKPDLGASPSELVYGEGLTVPGQLVGPPEMSEEELLRQQRSTLGNLRLEVERLQPVPTSAHRRPSVHIPEDLANASHVLIRKGVQPSLTAPYEGPFKVLARNQTGYRVQFPGRGSDEIALARLKPAFVSRDDIDAAERQEQDLEDAVPPSPPRPGRRPGIRTRQPAPTTRVTRSQAQHAEPQPGPSRDFDANEPIRSRSIPLTQSQPSTPSTPSSSQGNSTQSSFNDDHVDPTGFVDVPADPNLASGPDRVQNEILSQAFPHLPDPICRASAADPHPGTDQSVAGGSAGNRNSQLPNRGGARKTPSFSNPKPGHFSYRRRRPDINALQNLLKSLN